MKHFFTIISVVLIIALCLNAGCTKVIRFEETADPGSGIIQVRTTAVPAPSEPIRSSIQTVDETQVSAPVIIVTPSVARGDTSQHILDPKFPQLDIGEEFRFARGNVSMLKNLSVHATVYGYRFFEGFHWHSFSTGVDYFEPAPEGMVFLFVFVQIYTEDFSGHGEKIWLPSPDHFSLTVDGKVQQKPSDWRPVNLIKEIENVYNRNDDSRMKPYDYTITYTRSFESANDACTGQTIGDITYYGSCAYTTSGGYRANLTEVLQPGLSNAEDGYILWQVPYDWYNHDTRVIFDFYNFGRPEWILSEEK